MLPLVFFFISLIHTMNSSGAVVIGIFQRPSVHPQLCRNRDDLVGNEIFKNGDNPGDIAATLVAQANP